MGTIRRLLLFAGTGFVWFFALNLLFVWSGAQNILGNPAHQSSKFIKTFTEYAPLPRMATDNTIVWKGLWVAGIFLAAAFSFVNKAMKGNWLRRGITFGLIHWLVMVPWFEFYLPYNVMYEPLPLVLFEGLLWLGVTLIIGIYMSFITNYKASKLRMYT